MEWNKTESNRSKRRDMTIAQIYLISLQQHTSQSHSINFIHSLVGLLHIPEICLKNVAGIEF